MRRIRFKFFITIPTAKGMERLWAAKKTEGVKHNRWIYPDGLKERHEISFSPSNTQARRILNVLLRLPGAKIAPPWAIFP